MKRAVNLKTLVILFITLAVSYHFYERLTFNIENFMVHEIYNGDQEKYDKALISGGLKYCENYVRRYSGVPQTSINTVHYRRISDGRLMSIGGQLCVREFPNWDIRVFGFSFFDTKWKPLSCGPIQDLFCPENCPSLECAIRHGEINSAKRLLAEGADLNDSLVYNPDWPLLMYAISEGEFEIATLLINNGADVNQELETGLNALHRLSSKEPRDEEFLSLFTTLIDNEAKINHATKTGDTPLHGLIWRLGAYPIDIKILQSYLMAGADPNIQNYKGKNVLNHYMDRVRANRPKSMVRRQYSKVITLLIDYGADPNISDSEGLSAIDKAKEKGMDELVKLMRDYPSRSQNEE